MHPIRELFQSTNTRKRLLEEQWAADVARYREAGGRHSSRPDLPNPFLMQMADGEEQLWRTEFMGRFDSRTGEVRQ